MTIEEKVTEVINDYVSSNGTSSTMEKERLYSLVSEGIFQDDMILGFNLIISLKDVFLFENAYAHFIEQADKNAESKKAQGSEVPYGFKEKPEC